MTAVEETLETGAGSEARSFWRGRGAGWLRQQYPLLILIALLVIASLASDAFLTTRNLQNLVLQISVTGIVALAQLLVVISGGIDISVGSVLGLACVLSAGLFGGSSALVGLLVALVVGMVLGAVNGFLVAFRGLEPFIVTLGMLALARGLVYAYTEGSPLTPAASGFTVAGTTTIAGVPLLGIIWVLVAIGLAFLLRRTVFGRRVFAVGSRVEAAQASGIPVRGTLVAVYVIAGLLVGLGGFLLVSRVGAATPTAGNLFELDAIAAVVIGGARLNGGQGRVVGTVIGTAIFGVISNLLVLLNVSTFLQDAFRGALILLAVGLATIGRGRSARGH
ncbi:MULTISPECIES: ABC transporter permease [Amycolatopsis]|uniref:Ribose ABC transporter permease RbsC n=1 Tax=Amycolatopsis dongchuanensis TaxID=1070866 RepID=A0ABP8VQ48_9PSEU